MIDSLFLLVELVFLIIFLFFVRRGVKLPKSTDLGFFSYRENTSESTPIVKKNKKRNFDA